jgi:hypothetical protein
VNELARTADPDPPPTLTVGMIEEALEQVAEDERHIAELEAAATRDVHRSGTTFYFDGAPTLELNSPILTRPQDWAPAARRIVFPDARNGS